MLEELAANNYCIVDDFFGESLCRGLLKDLMALKTKQQLRQAGIGRRKNLSVNEALRGDQIAWISEDTSSLEQKAFLKKMNKLQHQLNQAFFLNLKHHEAHFAWYPPQTGYVKHIDQHADTRFRQITFVLYLNENWKPTDGGELTLYQPDDEAQIVRTVEPCFGRLILFRSEIFPHQVQVSKADRYSLTGWFRNDDAPRRPPTDS